MKKDKAKKKCWYRYKYILFLAFTLFFILVFASSMCPTASAGDYGYGCPKVTTEPYHNDFYHWYNGTIRGGIYFQINGSYSESAGATQTYLFHDVPDGRKIARYYYGVWLGSRSNKTVGASISTNGHITNYTFEDHTCPETYEPDGSTQDCPICQQVCVKENPENPDATVDITGCGVSSVITNVTEYTHLIPGENTIVWYSSEQPYQFALMVLYENNSMPFNQYWIKEGHEYPVGPSYPFTLYFNESVNTGRIYPGSIQSVTLMTNGYPHCLGACEESGYPTLNGNELGAPDYIYSYDAAGVVHEGSPPGKKYTVFARWDNIPPDYITSPSNRIYYPTKKDNDRLIVPVLMLSYYEPSELNVTDVSPESLCVDWYNTIDATIVNTGGTASFFNVTLYANGDVIDVKRVTNLGEGENTTVKFLWKPSAIGSYVLNVTADVESVVNETDKTNNSKTLNVEVKVASPPEWQSQSSNVSSIPSGGTIELRAQGIADVGLDHAVLATDETGTWKNCTSYGSPMGMASYYNYSLTHTTESDWKAQTLDNSSVVGDDVKLYRMVGTTNLAFEQLVSASSCAGSSYMPENAVDGTSDFWLGTYGTFPAWWYVNLGAVKDVQQIDIDFPDTWGEPYKYTVDISNNAADWTTKIEKSVGGDETFDNLEWSCQYIRVYIIEAYGTGWLYGGIEEFEAYGPGDYKSSGTLTSSEIGTDNPIVAVTPTWNSNEPVGTNISVNVSVDNGVTWKDASNGGLTWDYDALNNKLKYKVLFKTTDVNETPVLHDITLNYTTEDPVEGEWLWSNFTWQNASIPEGTTVAWKIYYEDMLGQTNCTDVETFVVGAPGPVIELIREQSNTTGLNQETTVRLVVWNTDSSECDTTSLNLTEWIDPDWSVTDCGNCYENTSTYIKWTLGDLARDNYTMVSYKIKAPASSEISTPFKANCTYKYDGKTGSEEGLEFDVTVESGKAFFDFELDMNAFTPTIDRDVPEGTEKTVLYSVTNVGDTVPCDTVFIELQVNKTAWDVTCAYCDEFYNDTNYYYLKWNESSWAVQETKVFNFTVNSSHVGYYNFSSNGTYDPPALANAFIGQMQIYYPGLLLEEIGVGKDINGSDEPNASDVVPPTPIDDNSSLPHDDSATNETPAKANDSEHEHVNETITNSTTTQQPTNDTLNTTNTDITEHADSDVKGRVIVGFKEKPDIALIKGHGGEIKHKYGTIPVIAALLPEKEIEALKNNPHIAYIERDYEVQAIENLPWGVDRIDAELVWNGTEDGYDITDGRNAGSGINISIIDTGIDYNHPDLVDNYKGGYDFVNSDADPMDDNGHGTHCAGIIAAGDNDIGVIGVAPEAGLYAVKVLDSSGSGYVSDVIAGIEWSVNNNMKIISMSLGSDSDSTALYEACDKAHNAGLLLVAAAGNSGNAGGAGDNVCYPARYESVIAVAATDINDNRASFSSTGPAVELAAPGVNIYSAYWDDTYASLGGTSVACPHVTGTAALVWNAYPKYNNMQVRQRLQETAEELGAAGKDTWYGYGLVNASEAASPTGSLNGSPAVTTPRTYDNTTLEEKTVFERNDSMFINVSISDVNGASDLNTVLITILNTTSATIVNNDTMTQDTPITNGYVYNYSWMVPDDADSGTWTIEVYANDTHGNVGSASVQFVVNLTNATIPENKNITVDLIAMKKHFALNKNPEFKFIVNYNITEGESKTKANETDAGLSAFDFEVTSEETVKTSVYDYKGELVDIESEIEKIGEGNFSIKVPSRRAFRAGLYTLKVELVKDNVTYVEEQDFTWGVLAINTHKSIYLPNETAFIGIAVLDDEGHMVCDADVTLTITDPDNKETVLSTDNGLIKVSPECCVYGVTNLPDYYTNYEVSGVGTYVMNLTAVTADGTKSITDEFTVQNSVDFDVARDGPTRIYPPVPYVMNFIIKANKNYTGLIKEYVPASFVITPQDGLTVTTVGDTKILTWNKNLAKGETHNIYYEFDAPDVSPYLFTLGRLQIGSFEERRDWMIASDAPDVETLDPIVHANTELNSVDLNQAQVDDITNDDTNNVEVAKGLLLTVEFNDTSQTVGTLNDAYCSLTYSTDAKFAGNGNFQVYDSFGGDLIDTTTIPESTSDNTIHLVDLETKGLSASEVATMVVYAKNIVAGKPYSFYVDKIECTIDYTPSADTTPPTYTNDDDNSSGSVTEGDIIKTHVYWTDADSNLGKAVLRTNKTGEWTNESWHTFAGNPEWANITFDTTGNAGKTICWAQWANDTPNNNNWNTSMSTTAHCFNVLHITKISQVLINNTNPAAGDIVEIEALLQYDNTSVIQNQNISFYYDSTYINSDFTNSTGWATITWDTAGVPGGARIINATYAGNASIYTRASYNNTEEIELASEKVWVTNIEVHFVRVKSAAAMDTTPPASITSLHNTTYAPTYINWSWINPEDADFSHVRVYINGTFKKNVFSPLNYYTATGLSPNTNNTISTHTVDTSGNVNLTWVNHSAWTAPASAGAPTVEIITITPDDDPSTSGVQINPVPNSVKTVTVTAQVSDPNDHGNISKVEITSITPNCSALPPPNINLDIKEVINPTTANYTGTFVMQFYDASETYTVTVTATDTDSLTGSNSSSFKYQTCIALALDTTLIDFGSVDPGSYKEVIGNTTFGDTAPTIKNNGNVKIDMKIRGTNMSGSGTIPVNNIADDLLGDGYTALSNTPVEHDELNLTAGASSVHGIDFKLNVPSGTSAGGYSGTVTLEAKMDD